MAARCVVPKRKRKPEGCVKMAIENLLSVTQALPIPDEAKREENRPIKRRQRRFVEVNG